MSPWFAVKIRVQFVLIPSAARQADCFEPCGRESNLYDNIWGDLCKGESLFDHAIGVVADDFGGDWALGQTTDLLEDLLVRAANLCVRATGSW